MAPTQNTVVIKAPIEKVFSFVADAENNTQWRLAVVSVKLRSGAAGKQGAIYDHAVTSPRGRVLKGTYTLLKVEPNKLVEFEVVAGRARPHGKFEFESVEGGTKLTFSLDLPINNPLVWLYRKPIRTMLYDEVANLPRLSHLLESQ